MTPSMADLYPDQRVAFDMMTDPDFDFALFALDLSL